METIINILIGYGIYCIACGSCFAVYMFGVLRKSDKNNLQESDK